MCSVKGSAPFEIMLSPQFYTLKRENLPVNYRYQAKRLAPSILENLLPTGVRHHAYYVYKEDDLWAFIAYDPEEIGKFLNARGIKAEQVSKIYFAQQVVEKFDMPVLLDENEAIVNVQGTATIIPSIFFTKETEYRGFDETFRPKEGASFAAGMHSIITQKEAWIIGAIFLIFALMFVIEGVRYRHVVAAIQEKVTLLLAEHPTLESQYSRANIAQKYETIDKEERQKREVLKDLSRLVLPGVEVENLLMEKKHFSMTLKSPDEDTVIRIQSLAKEKQYQVSRIGSEKLVKIEGNL